ncbi:MAG: BLUF domain-containing protein [Sphingomonadaceae bacterium]
MYQLAYISTFGLSVDEKDIADILEHSRANNRRDGINRHLDSRWNAVRSGAGGRPLQGAE